MVSPLPMPACWPRRSLRWPTPRGPVGEEARAYLRAMAERFAAVYRDAIAAGELPADADPDRLARRLQVKVLGLTVFLQRETDAAMLQDLVEDLVAEIAPTPATVPATAPQPPQTLH